MCDCSWCAAETGQQTTDSPTICAYHEALLLQQQEERKAQKEEKNHEH